MSLEKDQALAGLRVLIETCKSVLMNLGTLSRSVSTTQSAPVQVLRNDMLSLHRLIHTSTTRLSVALGKPPPSYPIALPPLKDLTKHVAQLSSCVSALPPGALRKEAVWAAEELLQALETLVQYFESRCRSDEKVGEEYLARTGAVHDAVLKAEKISRDEPEAVARAWRINGESLEDSLKEVKEMMDETDNDASEDNMLEDDGWNELGEGFGGKLNSEEMERVKKIYPLVRLTTLLHGRILSHHILKPPASGPHSGAHLLSLLQLSDNLLPTSDDLVSALYAPQDSESIQEAAEAVYKVTKGFDRELASENSDEEAARQALERLRVQDSDKGAGDAGEKTRKWFQQCFAQIGIIHGSLSLEQPS